VPESKEIDDLLYEFENNNEEIAIMVDEYGDVSGLVTVKDIINEIMSDIFEKRKTEIVFVKNLNENQIRVDVRVSLKEVNKFLKLDLKEEHFNTIAGYIMAKLKKIPEKGSKLS